ncbi:MULTISPECIES: serine/threonine protein kinase [unclassified Micromonospora]|uniref:serine/threonine protein kinase n=1 Tax=unclassified Micromonospora TaxID=2617518 RepID=UPI00098D2EE8|nr:MULTISPECIES: serine/threonine-protein kinase [unclassified Micromonospora]OON32266.1 protein kinase [Micromonospora sp. Rc5]
MSNALPQLVADRYRLLSPLGQGGMGRVWKARDEVLHRDVAIKELVPPPSLTPEERREMRERSLREARAIARLNHVNVVRIFDVLRTDGDPWIVMEYVASKSLQDTIAEDGPVTSAKAVEIGLGVLGALKAAHKAGVMHRDVKPGNVLIGTDGRVVLTDFGLATIPGDPNVTRTGMVLGSPAYIAPERARDGTAGPEADLWSLGATLYAAVEGKSPYARPSAIATLAALATEPMPPPRNAGPLKPVLNGLLRKDPAERIDAEVAERLLRKAAGRRSKTISLLDGVRRPGPNGPREPRPPVVPAPRPAEPRTSRPAVPPAPRTPGGGLVAGGAAVTGAAGDDATAKVSPPSTDAAPTAKVPSPGVDAAPTAKVDPPASGTNAAPTAKVADTGARAADPTAKLPGPVAATGADRVAGAPVDGSEESPAEEADEAGSGEVTGTGGAVDGVDAAPAGQVDDTRVDPGPAVPVSPPAPPVERAEPAGDQADASGDQTDRSRDQADRPQEDAGPSSEKTGPSSGKAGPPREWADRARERATPTSVLPAAAGPAPSSTGRAAVVSGTKPERSRRSLLVGVLVAVLLLGLLVAVPLLGRGDDDPGPGDPQAGLSSATPSAAAPSSPAPATSSAAPPSPTPSATPSVDPNALPEGWVLHKDPAGFSLPLPKGWVRRNVGQNTIVFDERDGVGELLVQWTNTPQPDAVADWREQEPARKSRVNNYQYLSIERCDYYKTCADWEWLETRDNTRIHVRNRGFVTAKNRGYAFRWEVANKDWQARLADFDRIAKGFEPDRVD